MAVCSDKDRKAWKLPIFATRRSSLIHTHFPVRECHINISPSFDLTITWVALGLFASGLLASVLLSPVLFAPRLFAPRLLTHVLLSPGLFACLLLIFPHNVRSTQVSCNVGRFPYKQS